MSELGGDHFVVTVYNPLSHILNHTVRIPVTAGTYKVQGQPDGKTIYSLSTSPVALATVGHVDLRASRLYLCFICTPLRYSIHFLVITTATAISMYGTQ